MKNLTASLPLETFPAAKLFSMSTDAGDLDPYLHSPELGCVVSCLQRPSWTPAAGQWQRGRDYDRDRFESTEKSKPPLTFTKFNCPQLDFIGRKTDQRI